MTDTTTAVPRKFRDLPPALLIEVQRICRGQWNRCELHNDGSVTVHNNPVSHKEKAR